MSTQTTTFETYLRNFTEADWNEAVDSIKASIHEADKNAVRIWFRFYPLSLNKYLLDAPDIEEAKRGLAMQGDFGLSDKIDSSHSFLYGHRYWPCVKKAIESEAAAFSGDALSLHRIIENVAGEAVTLTKADISLLLGISAIGLMTFAQVGWDRFAKTTGDIAKPRGIMGKGPDAVLNSRRADDSQGIFGFLKTVDKKFSVIHDEQRNGRFDIVNDQEIASASANDCSENWQAKDERCWEGPVPVECTSASCGTCWVGVIAGAEKLSDVERRERRAIKVFGYDQTDDSKPLIRLACQAKAYGNVTIVIPPWNAVFGKKVYGNVDELELEPVTTSAKHLREVVLEAAAGEAGD